MPHHLSDWVGTSKTHNAQYKRINPLPIALFLSFYTDSSFDY